VRDYYTGEVHPLLWRYTAVAGSKWVHVEKLTIMFKRRNKNKMQRLQIRGVVLDPGVLIPALIDTDSLIICVASFQSSFTVTNSQLTAQSTIRIAASFGGAIFVSTTVESMLM